MKPSLRRLLASAFVLSLTQIATAAVETYVIDNVHSSLGFSIRHFVSKVPGTFTTFAGTIHVDRGNLENSSVEATIEVGSVNTAEPKRDNHLKSADFFDVANHGTATFKSRKWTKTGEDTFDVTGDLTLHGVTKEVVLHTTLLGFGDGNRGAKLSGWEATTTIKKSDFGVNGPAVMGKTLGDEVALRINLEAVLKP